MFFCLLPAQGMKTGDVTSELDDSVAMFVLLVAKYRWHIIPSGLYLNEGGCHLTGIECDTLVKGLWDCSLCSVCAGDAWLSCESLILGLQDRREVALLLTS